MQSTFRLKKSDSNTLAELQVGPTVEHHQITTGNNKLVKKKQKTRKQTYKTSK